MPRRKQSIILKSISHDQELIDRVNRSLVELFKSEIYLPLMKELGSYGKIENSERDLLDAIHRGKISFYRGKFTGKFNSKISRELRKLGASWSSKDGGSFSILKSELPDRVNYSIGIAEYTWLKKSNIIQKKISKISSEEFASKIDFRGLVAKELFKVSADIDETMQGMIVSPKLTEKEAKEVAEEYNDNMKLYIQKFTEKEIKSLRKKVEENVLEGRRYEGLAKIIEKSYGVSESKSKFLARQETNLFLAKFKEARYTKAGVEEYIWQTVVGSPAHPVRDGHKKLNGKKFKFSDPPVVNEKGDRKNPGEDYNCRCTARPVVKF